MTRDLDIKEFAQRVERLCDFFINKIKEENNGKSSDLKVFEDLKEDAADIQSDQAPIVSTVLRGLDGYMRGSSGLQAANT